jgi:hypothetical protein
MTITEILLICFAGLSLLLLIRSGVKCFTAKL